MDDGRSKSSGASASESKPKSLEPTKSAPTKVGGAMAAILHQSKTRKRKGSLRKTALLGKSSQPTIHNIPSTLVSPVKPNRGPYGSLSPASSNELLTIKSVSRPQANASSSTTDEDDNPSLNHTPTVESHAPAFPKKVPGSDGYFPPLSPRHVIRPPAPKPSRSATRSPLASLPPSFPLPTPSEHSYAETAYWGWFILFVTWIVFVVGMGSCFEVWSWAWDVGETPYAPPELEDDPTLPIVGYYPCLIILTGIMAWVWVVVAWVGMKYFKHAKMGGDEG